MQSPSPKRSIAALCLSVMLLLHIIACLTPIDDTCSSQADCFRDQVCAQGRCQRADLVDMAQTPEMSAPTKDMSSRLPICVTATPNTSCQDAEQPRNDRRTDATVVTTGGRTGCFTEDDLRPFRSPSPIQGRRCPDQDADYYRVDFIECTKADLIVTATLRPEPVCDEGFATLKAFINGKELSCGQDPQLSCATLPSGALERTITLKATSTPQVGSIYFATDGAQRPDVLYDYVLDIKSTIGETP